MSTLQNEMILEDLFDETVAELIQSGNYLNFDKNVMYSIAEKITREKFDDLCQQANWTLNPLQGVF